MPEKSQSSSKLINENKHYTYINTFIFLMDEINKSSAINYRLTCHKINKKIDTKKKRYLTIDQC